MPGTPLSSRESRRAALAPLALALVLLTAGPAAAQSVRLARVGSFASPVYLTAPPGDRERLFVAERGGRIRVVKDGKKLRRPFLDISGEVVAGGEQGLLGLAFPPDYDRSGLFYVYYTARAGGANTIREFRRSVNPDVADRSSARQVLSVPDFAPNHNGGQLVFGPDGLLYAGLGDGGAAGDPRGNAQNLGALLGKILRIDPRQQGGRPYSVPGSNPFTGRQGASGEVYAYGLRNPWRFSFDRATGDLAIGDVGQNEVEEVNFVREGRGRGANFGWDPFEGRRRHEGGAAPGHVPPVLQRFHSQGSCSITGGYVVRDRSLRGLYGRYVYGDFCDARLRHARLRPGRARGNRRLGLRVESLSSFGEDAEGRVYALSLDGPVYRLAPRPRRG